MIDNQNERSNPDKFLDVGLKFKKILVNNYIDLIERLQEVDKFELKEKEIN